MRGIGSDPYHNRKGPEVVAVVIAGLAALVSA